MIILFKNKAPFIEGVNINDLAKKIETPFYVYSQKSIIEKYNNLKKTIDAEIFYAIKANSNQAIITLIRSLGAGADVVSVGELKRALNAKVEPKKIIFEGVGKSKTDIEFAITSQIKQINIESLEELEKINEIGLSLDKVVNVGIRINPDIDSKTHNKISTGKKTDKFGIDFDILPNLCTQITNYKYIKLNGISCHIGSQITDINIFEKFFLKMKKALEIFKNNNIQINYLDLGGGFGVTYQNENEIDLNKLSNLINKLFGDENLKISIEPGRYLVANAGVLITKILTIKKSGSINYLITDAGMQTLIRPALYNAIHKIISFEKNDDKKVYTIAGPICESSDVFSKNIELPIQETGNFLAICDTGAYGSVMASNYNSRSLPAEVLINDNKYSVIRKKEDIQKFINLDIIPDWL